jgi:CBS domain containing-hemolysin-like protein
VAALILAAFAAAAETALTSVSRIRVRTLANEGDRRAKRLVRLHNDPNGYLSTILSINMIAVIVATSVVTSLTIDAHRFPEALVTVILAIAVLIFCEIAPKSLALRYNEGLSLHLARPVSFLTKVLRPLIGSLTLVSRLMLRISTRGKNVRGPFVTEEELLLLLAVGEKEGVVEEEERQMIHGILEMTDKAVREVMVPRVDVVGLEVSQSTRELISLIIDSGHSRIPIYEQNLDNIVGVIYAKDLLRAGVRSDDKTPLKRLVREPYYTPEAKHVGELLREMQERKVHMAIVVEEHGGTAGLVTFEDLIEEIVGPVRDEYDEAEQEEIEFINDHEVRLSARVPIDDVKEMLHLQIDDVDADSIGGLVYAMLGEIPKAGATITIGDAKLTVESVRRQSIQTVRITSDKPFARERNDEDDDDSPEPSDSDRRQTAAS